MSPAGDRGAKRSLFERVFPGIAARRARAFAERARYEADLVRHIATAEALKKVRTYDAAAAGRRGEGWIRSDGSANAETFGNLSALRARSREAVRNDPWVRNAVNAWVSNAVGNGLVPSFASDSAPSEGGETKLRRAEQLMTDWREWAESTDPDLEGLTTFYGLQSLAFRTVVESGDCVLMPVYGVENSTAKVSLSVAVLEGDYIDTNRTGTEEGGNITIQGIEYSKKTRERVGVWLVNKHPGENLFPWVKPPSSNGKDLGGHQSKRYSIPDEAMVVMRQDRPGQARGVPWTVAALLRAKDLLEMEDAKLVQQKIAACYSAFIRDIDSQAAASGTPSKTDDGDWVDTFSPGMIEELPPGKTIEIAQPQMPHGYSEYQQACLRSMAAGMGVSYEAMTNDYSKVNYSSGRLGGMEFNRNIEQAQRMLIIPQICETIWSWFKLAATVGSKKDMVRARVERWIPPKRGMTDPAKEVPADISRMESMIASPQEIIAATGNDPYEVLRKIAEFRDYAESLDIHFGIGEKPEPPVIPGQAEGGAKKPPNDKKEGGDNASASSSE